MYLQRRLQITFVVKGKRDYNCTKAIELLFSLSILACAYMLRCWYYMHDTSRHIGDQVISKFTRVENRGRLKWLNANVPCLICISRILISSIYLATSSSYLSWRSFYIIIYNLVTTTRDGDRKKKANVVSQLLDS